MALLPTQGQSIIVDTPDSVDGQPSAGTPGQDLVSWLTPKATAWESVRTRAYGARWGEYWRIWRGMWAPDDKNRLSERSRLIAPALSQAIEMTVSEIEESVFAKDVWFDLTDDVADQERIEKEGIRDLLLEDLNKVNAKDAVAGAVLNAAIFGTGLLKLNVEVYEEKTLQKNEEGKLEAKGNEEVRVVWEAIRPDEFIPDPAGRTIQEMLGMFHKVKVPMHVVLERIQSGQYRKDALEQLAPRTSGNMGEVDPHDPQAFLTSGDAEEVEVLEYHGKVPLSALNKAVGAVGESRSLLDEVLETPTESDGNDGPLIEAIVTLGNDGVLLRARPNPFVMTDRNIVAFQLEKVPGRFWGRGVAEKGFNPQKALDAELRSRIDALGFTSSPMLGMDVGRVPRGFKPEVKPGKIWLTQGPPREILQPIDIGQLNPSSFNQTQEMERMVQMGTGAFDTATKLKGADANGPQAASLMMGAFVKRAKRSIRNVNENLLEPAIKKTLWRYMQFSPSRYTADVKFRIMASLGIVAREVEALQLTQTMAMLPEAFPQVNVAIAKGIIDLSAVHNKAEVMAAMDKAMEPPSEEEQKKQAELEEMQFESIKAEAQGKLLENQETLAKIRKLLAEAEKSNRQADVEEVKVSLESERIDIARQELEAFEQQNLLSLKRLQIQEKQVDAKIEDMKKGER